MRTALVAILIVACTLIGSAAAAGVTVLQIGGALS